MRVILTILTMFFGNAVFCQHTVPDSYCLEDDALQKKWEMIGACMHDGSSYDKCISLLEEIAICFDNKKNKPAYQHLAGYHYNMSFIYLEKGELDSAKLYLDELDFVLSNHEVNELYLEYYTKALKPLNGKYYFKRGWYELASNSFEETIDALFSEVGYSGDEKINLAAMDAIYPFSVPNLFNNAALSFSKFGEYEKAILYYNIALGFEKEENELQDATIHLNLARSHTFINSFSLAKKHFDLAEKIFLKKRGKETSSKLGNTYKNKAEYYYKNGKKTDALFYLDKSLSLEIEDRVRVFANQLYAQILTEEKRLGEAAGKIGIAKEYTRSSQGERHPEMAENFQLEADWYQAQKKYREADGKYNKALGILTRQESCDCNKLIIKDVIEKRMAMNIIRNKAKNLFLIEGDEEWRDCYDLLDDLTRELNNKYILSEGSKYNLAKEAKGFYAEAIGAFVARGEKEKAYEFSRLAKGMVLMQQIQDKKAIEAGFIPRERIEEGKKLKSRINELQKIREKAFINNENDLMAGTEKKIITIENQYGKWVEEIEKEYKAYYYLKYDGNIKKIDKIQNEIASRNATVLEYFLGENKLYLFIVNEKDVEVLMLDLYDGFKSDINKLHRIISNNIYDIESFNEFTGISHHLYKTLISKAANENNLKENIIIIPDEEINLISFEALIADPYILNSDRIAYEKLDYLLDKYHISYQYSANLIPGDRNNKIKNKFLGIAPSFNNENIIPLRYNKEEIISINKKMTGKILLDSQGSRANLIKYLDDYNIIHFATHAVFNDQVPLDSRIELTDTSLYIYELLALEHELDLVVLSACETASGKRLKGEGVISLSRALIQSGCQTVISSLWEVSDQKAGQLMNHFYDHFSKRENSKKSLTQAKREFLSGTISRNTHPFYWAGFVQIGKPLELDAGWSVYHWFMIGGIVVFVSWVFFRSIFKNAPNT